jgi:ATP-dependent helicase/nuclease subunit B
VFIQTFCESIRDELQPFQEDQFLCTLWIDRARSIAKWVYHFPRGVDDIIHHEVQGKWTFYVDKIPYTLKARADCLIERPKGLIIYDYKTGAIPSPSEMRQGFAPQLPLEALISQYGSFGKVGKTPLIEIAFLALKREGEHAHIAFSGTELAQMMKKAKSGIESLLRFYRQHNSGYAIQPFLRYAPRYNDYAHLERVITNSSQT